MTNLQLDWRQNSFEFEYVALNFTNSVKNRYQYFLEGYDKKWFDAGPRQFGRYSGLPGGTYTLRVRGSNNDGVWSRPDQEVSVTLWIASPPWKSWWAYLAYVVIGALALVVFMRWRLRAVDAQKRQLQELVGEQTKELAEKEAQLRLALDNMPASTGSSTSDEPSPTSATACAIRRRLFRNAATR